MDDKLMKRKALAMMAKRKMMQDKEHKMPNGMMMKDKEMKKGM